MSIPVFQVVLHEYPDLDTIAAYWLALKHPEIFVGIGPTKTEKNHQKAVSVEGAPIVFLPQDPTPETMDLYTQEGTVCFDVGGGQFDHHPHGKDNGQYLTKSATYLVAEYLGITDDPIYRQVIDYVQMHDLEGPAAVSRKLRDLNAPEELVRQAQSLERFSFINVMRLVRQKRNPQDFVKWVCRFLDVFYEHQWRFWNIIKQEYLDKTAILPVATAEREYRVAVIESDQPEVGSFSRTSDGGGCAICVQRTTDSHVFISGSVQQITSPQFLEISKFLRVWEMRKRNITVAYDLPDLTKSRLEICPVWYLPMNRSGEIFIIMNGGHKATNIEPTILTNEEIFCAVSWGLDEHKLHHTCPKTSCLGRKCPFYHFGLARCQTIRELS